MSVPLQSVPDNPASDTDAMHGDDVAQAKHEAAEIVARARRQADEIVAKADSSAGSPAPNPLAALGDNAEEIIGQVRKLIQKQREMQTERQGMLEEIEALKSERDELVQRLTDAVERMEELARLADMAQSGGATQPPEPPPMAANPPARTETPVAERHDEASKEDTSLAARLRQAEEAERREADHGETDDSSLAARLERAERERNAKAEADAADESPGDEFDTDGAGLVIGADGRSFYDRHSAKLPRLEGDGGRSVLSAIGDMRPESDPKARKGRRRGRK